MRRKPVSFPASKVEHDRLNEAARIAGVPRTDFLRHEVGHVLNPPYLPSHLQARLLTLRSRQESEQERAESVERELEHVRELHAALPREKPLARAAKALHRRAQALEEELRNIRIRVADLGEEIQRIIRTPASSTTTSRASSKAHGVFGFALLGFSSEATAWTLVFVLGLAVVAFHVAKRFGWWPPPVLSRFFQSRGILEPKTGPSNKGAPKPMRRTPFLDGGETVDIDTVLDHHWRDEGTFSHRLQTFLDQDDGLERARLVLENHDWEALDENGELVPVRLFIATQAEARLIPLEVQQSMASRRSRKTLPPAAAGTNGAHGKENGNGHKAPLTVETGATTPAPGGAPRKRGRPTKEEAERRKKQAEGAPSLDPTERERDEPGPGRRGPAGDSQTSGSVS